MAPMTISGSNPWLMVEKTMNAREEIPVSCTWEIEIIEKDARLLIINDKVSGGRVVSKECYPCSFRVFKLSTIFFPFLKTKDQRPNWSLDVVLKLFKIVKANIIIFFKVLLSYSLKFIQLLRVVFSSHNNNDSK